MIKDNPNDCVYLALPHPVCVCVRVRLVSAMTCFRLVSAMTCDCVYLALPHPVCVSERECVKDTMREAVAERERERDRHETETETETETEREKERQRDRETERKRKRDRQTERAGGLSLWLMDGASFFFLAPQH